MRDRMLGVLALYVGLSLHVAALALSYLVRPTFGVLLHVICWAARVPPLPPLTPRDVEQGRTL